MIARLRGRLSESGGYTLSEMVVVLAILGIVVGALVQLFASASNAQVDMSKRYESQHNARLALDKLRREIHCAKSVSGTVPGNSIAITLGSYCPTNTTGADQTITWCVTGSSAPFTLRRSTGACTATSQEWADYLTTATVFTGYVAPQGGSTWAPNTAYTAGQLVRPTSTGTTPYIFSVTAAGTSGATEPTWPTALNATVGSGTVTFKNLGALTFGLGQLSVDLPIDLTPGDTKQRYELKDDIVLRNTTR